MPEISPRLDILPQEQRGIWPMLRSARKLGFVLHGGTAVALRYGHRVSVDYDFFGPRSFDKDRLSDYLADVMRDREVLQDAPDTLTIVSHAVKISFFGVGLDPLGAWVRITPRPG